MFKALAIITTLQVFAAACETDLKLTTVSNPKLSAELCNNNSEIRGCRDFLDSLLKEQLFKLEQISPINSYQRYVITLIGDAFDEHLELTIEGQDVPVFKLSATEVFFLTPSFESPGIKTAALKRLERSIEFKIFILADKSIDPASLNEPAQLCEGSEFMLGDGSIALGSKACANLVSAVNCSADGEVGCMTTPIFTAADTSSAANKILAGQSMGGVEGNVALPAVSKVLIGEVFGAVGQALSGTLTLPATGKVLSGTSYGVSGSGSTGTLSLPLAGAVRSSAGAYGDPGSAVTGTIGDCAANG